METMVCAQAYTTPVAEVDLRPGGAGQQIVMQSPESQDIPCHGQLSGDRPEPQDRRHRRFHGRLAARRKALHDHRS